MTRSIVDGLHGASGPQLEVMTPSGGVRPVFANRAAPTAGGQTGRLSRCGPWVNRRIRLSVDVGDPHPVI